MRRRRSQAGFTVPVVVTVFSDRSFTFLTKTLPASDLLMKAAGLKRLADAQQEQGRPGD